MVGLAYCLMGCSNTIFSSLISFTASVPTSRSTEVLVCLTSLKVRSRCVTLYVAAEDGLGASVGDLGAPPLAPDP